MSDHRRTPIVVRYGNPDESRQLEALKLLLKIGSRKAASVSSTDGDDGTKIKEDSANAILHVQRRT